MTTSTQLRRGVAALATLANADLANLWAHVDTATQARDGLRDVLPALLDTYGAAAGTLAANWYDDLRDKSGARGNFSAIPAEIADMGADALAGWGVSPLFQAEPDFAAARTLVEGGLQRRIANVSRLTVAGSSIADPAADGWQRTGSGACGFCAMLIGRGAVYTEASADFASHDHCNCAAVPAFGGEPRPVKPYAPSASTSTPAELARVRAYIADMKDVGLVDVPTRAPSLKVGDVDESFKGANPKFNREGHTAAFASASNVPAELGYNYNCTNAVTAYEMRMRGQAVTARAVSNPALEGNTDDFLARWRKPDGEALTWDDMSQTKGLRGTQDLVKSWDDGGRGFVMVQWKRDGGHVFVAQNDGGKVRFLDPQSGAEYAESKFQQVATRRVWAVRSDDLEPMADFGGYVE